MQVQICQNFGLFRSKFTKMLVLWVKIVQFCVQNVKKVNFLSKYSVKIWFFVWFSVLSKKFKKDSF